MSRQSHAYALLQHLYQALLLNQRRTCVERLRRPMIEPVESRMMLSAGFDHLYKYPHPLGLDSGGEPNSVVATDLNRDGRPDIAAAEWGLAGGSISVFLNQGLDGAGDVAFSGRSTYDAGDKAWLIAAADFNNDGAPELIVAGSSSAQIAVLPNDGNGVFGTAMAYTASSYARDIATGDFNKDGYVDMAIATGTGISVFINDTHGGFLSPNDVTSGTGGSIGIAAADVDGDGRLDLLASAGDWVNDAMVVSLKIFSGSVNGSFSLSTTISLDHQPFGSVVAADLDGDGRPEAVLANSWDNSLTVVDSIASSPTLADYATGSWPRQVVAADVNGDGHLDLVNVNYQSPGHSFSVVGNNGDGTFAAPVRYEAYADNPVALAAADFAGTGYTDVAILQINSFAVDIYRNIMGRDITFPDPALNKAVHDALGISDYNEPITGSELLGLTDLVASNAGITNLAGLEYAANLQTLNLSGNRLTNLYALNGLDSLISLRVDYNNLDIRAGSDDRNLINGLLARGVNVIYAPQNADTNVWFDDANLEQAVRLTLELQGQGIPSWQALTAGDMANLYALGAYNMQITSLRGLEYATNLQQLYLGSNNISDISPLAGLYNIRRLELFDNHISDLSPLSTDYGLQTLSLGGNPLGNLSDLAPLVNLTELDLDHAGLIGVDFWFLQNMTSLTILQLGHNSLQGLTNLDCAASLTDLYLDSNNDLRDIHEVANLPNLRVLTLRSCISFSDLSQLGTATTLVDLDLSYTPVADIRALNGLTSLQRLDLTYTPVADISALYGLSSLQYLTIGNTQVTDIGPVSGMTSLRGLYMDRAPVASLAPLAGMTQLTNLRANAIPATDFSTLAGLTGLMTLELQDDSVGDIGFVANMTQLSTLDLSKPALTSDVGVEDITPLANLTDLTYLQLYGNHIRHLDVINWDNLTALNAVSLAHNYLALGAGAANMAIIDSLLARSPAVSVNYLPQDVPAGVIFNDSALEQAVREQLINDGNGIDPGAPLSAADLLKLTSLNASYRGITDLTGLEFATNLQNLDLSGNSFSDISPIAHLSNITQLNLDGSPIGNAGVATIAAGMPDLHYLNVSWGGITDVSPLAVLHSLDALYLVGNGSLDLSTASGLTGLSTLYVSACGLNDATIAALNWGDFTQLTSLAVDDNAITNLSFVTKLSSPEKLSWLLAYRCQITDISPLSLATGLTELWIGGNQISDISPLAGATSMQYLDISGGHIKDISLLSGMHRLFMVNVSGNDITTLAQVDWSNKPSLYYLDVRWNHIDIETGSPSRNIIDGLLTRGMGWLMYDPQSANIAPDVAMDPAAPSNEGSLWSGAGRFFDSNADTWTATVDYGDGSGIHGLALNSDKTFSLSHQYADNGNFTVSVSVNDGSATGSSSFTVHSLSVSPTGTLGMVGAAVEGATATFKFAGQHDPSSADTTAGFSYSYSLDGGAFAAGAATYLLPGDRIPNGPSTHTLRGRIIDKDGASSEYSLLFKVQNAIPAVTIPAAAAISVGGTYTATGSFADSGLDTWTAKVNYGDGSGLQSLALAGKTFALSHVYVSTGVFTVTVWVTDNDGATGTATRLVTVNQLPPQVTGVIVNDGTSAQRSMVTSITCTFSSVVTLDAGAFSLIRSDGQTVALSYTAGPAASFTLTFTSGPLEGVSLADGRYTFSVIGSKVHLGATTMAGTATSSITRLFGDSDGDGDVDGLDVKAFTLAYTKSRSDPAYQWYFDLDSNNVVDAIDYKAFRLRLNKSV